MIERKFLPAILIAGFLVTAGVSGGATLAVLSDRAGVSVGIPADSSETWNVTNMAGTTPDGASTSENATATPTPTQTRNATAVLNSVEGDAIAIALKPADQTIEADGVAKYDVVVKGTSDKIVGYDLSFELSDPSVASFKTFEHKHEDGDESVNDGKMTVSAGLVDAIGATDTVTLGTIVVTGDASGETELVILNERGDRIDVLSQNNTLYDVGATGDGVLTVQTNETSDSGNGNSG